MEKLTKIADRMAVLVHLENRSEPAGPIIEERKFHAVYKASDSKKRQARSYEHVKKMDDERLDQNQRSQMEIVCAQVR